MADMTKTTMATYLPAVWSKVATITYRSNIVIDPLLDHTWEPELGVGRGNTINIPNFTQNNAANTRSTFGTGASITFDAVTESQTQLLVDQFIYKAFRMPVEMAVQVMPVYVSLLIEGIGKAVALKWDNILATDSSNGLASISTKVGTDNVDITEDNLLTCETNIAANNAQEDDRFAVVSPASRASLFKIDRVANSLYKGSVGNLAGDKVRGYLGHYLTLDVYESNNLGAGSSGKKNAVFQREVISVVTQKSLTMEKTFNMQDGAFDQYMGWMVAGLKRVKDGFGNELDGK